MNHIVLASVKAHVFKTRHVNSNEWKATQWDINQMCTCGHAATVFQQMYTLLVEFKRHVMDKYVLLEATRRWLLKNPVFPGNRDVNRLIVSLAFPHSSEEYAFCAEYDFLTGCMEMDKFYFNLNIYYLPEQHRTNTTMLMPDGREILVPKRVKKLYKKIWPKIKLRKLKR